MLPTLIVGAVFFAIVAAAAYKSFKSMRNNSCPGCSGGCTAQEKKSCSSK